MSLHNEMLAAIDDEHEMMRIINRFKPIILKYSILLNDEEAIQDLTLHFIYIVKIKIAKFPFTEDKYLLSYIKKAMRNRYIYLSKLKAKHKQTIESGLCLSDNFDPADPLSNVHFMDTISILSKRQREIMYLKYYCCYTDAEIAKQYSITRQAVNRIKNQALKVLKKSLTKEE